MRNAVISEVNGWIDNYWNFCSENRTRKFFVISGNVQPSVGFPSILAEKTFIYGFTLTCYYWALLLFGIG